MVDDEPPITDFLERGLRFKGFEVTTASNGRQALNAVQKNEPDLVLLDVLLPVINSYEGVTSTCTVR